MLRTYPSILLWQPACAKGEDAYALAIVLHEAGLFERCRIYATDLNEVVLRNAREATFPVDRIAQYTEQYLAGGGTSAFSDYYRVHQDQAVLLPFLRERIVFAEHSLATDGPFNEFQVILCRDALKAFNGWLQERVCGLFMQSLSRFGILGLGLHESPKLPSGKAAFEWLPGPANLYRKVR
jgi:chemotaxis protein methyltransferase CheR